MLIGHQRLSVLANQPPAYITTYLISSSTIGVSLEAVACRFHSLGLISEWHYRTLCIDFAKKGFRTTGPEEMKRGKSQLLIKEQDYLKMRKQGWRDIAKSLNLSADEINSLTFRLTPPSVIKGEFTTKSTKISIQA